jgi:uncharacterized protein (TIGR02145 family)
MTNLGSIVSNGTITGSNLSGTNTGDNAVNSNYSSLVTMTYPTSGIALSTGSAWGTSITNNSANWNTAYGWGNHSGLYLTLAGTATNSALLENHAASYFQTALGFTPYNATNPAGYISSYTETDPRLPAVGTSGNLLKSDGSAWTSWTPNYLTSYTETDPIFTAWNKSTGISITESQISNLQNYLTSYTETDATFTSWYNTSSPSLTNLTLTNQLISTLADGTTPMQITSTTKVANLNADLLDGFDSSAFGDATAANQTEILTRIGTNADVASMSSTLFAGQQYIADGVDAVAVNVNTLVSSSARTGAGTFFSVGGSPNYCKKKVVDSNGLVVNTNINNSTTCDTGKVCNNGVCDTSWTCGTSQISDADGNSYNTVLVNTQCWMASNLNVGVRIIGAGTQTNNSTIEKYCYADTDANCTTDGGLYLWDEAMGYSTTEGARGICPTGWHVPTDAQQYALENYLQTTTCSATRTNWGCDPAGTKLKTGGTSGMNFPLAGYRVTDGSFLGRTTYATIWSSSQSGDTAWSRHLDSANATVNRNPNSKAYGFSVRCLKD